MTLISNGNVLIGIHHYWRQRNFRSIWKWRVLNEHQSCLIFYSILSDHGKLIDYLRTIYLLDNERNCRKCAKEMKLAKRANKMDMEEWRCDSCKYIENLQYVKKNGLITYINSLRKWYNYNLNYMCYRNQSYH